jgi:hypothetical protein
MFFAKYRIRRIEMKKLLGLLVIVAMAGAGCLVYVPSDGTQPVPARDYSYENDRAPYGNLDIGYFYDYMQPYGLWVNYAPYGYVWIPRDVGYRWRPYTRGRWAWTDYGWTWISLERWGWAAYHYGRWGWDGRLGWYWVPDIIWGPAWVAWRWGDINIGWAPLPPGVDFVPGRGFGRPNWNIPGRSGNFVNGRDFMDSSLDRWVLPVERNATIINRTVIKVNVTVRDNRVVDDGVDLDHVRRLTNHPIDKFVLKEAPRAGESRVEGRDVVLYKPIVSRSEAAKPKAVLDRDRAVGQIDAERAGQVSRTVPRDESATIRQAHEQELKLMQRSQDSEINEIRRKAEADKAKVQKPEEKKKLDEQVQSRILELKKKHQEEKAELTKRQKEEETKAKTVPVKKKKIEK